MKEATVDGPDPIDVQVGANLRTQRIARRLTLEALGNAAGVAYQQIQRYELGTNRMGASVLYRLARALRVEIDALFENVDGIAPPLPAGEDVAAVLALNRIEDPAVRDTLRGLIGLLDRGPKAV